MNSHYARTWWTCFLPQLAASCNLLVLLLDFSCYFILDLFVCFMNKVIFIEPFCCKFETKSPVDMLVSFMATELKLKTLSLNINSNRYVVVTLLQVSAFQFGLHGNYWKKYDGVKKWFISNLSVTHVNNSLFLSNDITQYLLDEQPFGGEE